MRLPDGARPYSTIGPIAIVEDVPGGHLYNEVVAITSLSSRSRSTLETAFAVNSPGSACLIYHDKSEKPIATMAGDMTLSRRTGVHRGLGEDRPMAHTLTTIFEIKAADAPEYPPDSAMFGRPIGTDPKTVARCVVAYRDASRWSSVGPSIRMFMVRRDYQGIGLAQQLFDEVEKWYVKNWVLSTNKGNRVLKATKLKDYIVDRRDEMEGRPPVLMTDKMFFYDVSPVTWYLSLPCDEAGQKTILPSFIIEVILQVLRVGITKVLCAAPLPLGARKLSSLLLPRSIKLFRFQPRHSAYLYVMEEPTKRHHCVFSRMFLFV